MGWTMPGRRRYLPILALISAGVLILGLAVALDAGDEGASWWSPAAAGSGPAPRPAQPDAARCDEAALSTCLIKPPSRLRPVDTAWGRDSAPDAQDYTDEYDVSGQAGKVAMANFEQAGLQAMAHLDVADDAGEQLDIVLMRFSRPQGAQARALQFQGAILRSAGSSSGSVRIAGLPGEVYPAARTNSDGQIKTVYPAAVGNLLMVVHFYSPGTFDQTDFTTWTTAQLRALQTASIPAPAPFTRADDTVSCAAALDACLITPPDGSRSWSDDWGLNRTPTMQQFAQHMYPTSYVPRAEARLKDQDLVGIAHETWHAANGDEADLVLLDFATTQGARSRTVEELHYRDGADFSVSGPGSAGGTSLTKPDSAGMYRTMIYGYSGTIAVEVHAFAAKSLDRAEAIAWAQSEFEWLSSRTRAGTAAVSTPRVPPGSVGHVGTASCSTPIDCLLTPPIGAIGWTDNAYDKTTSVSLNQFVDEQYSDPADRQYELGILKDSGGTSAVHRDWTAPDGNEADVTLLVFDNAFGARSDALGYQGAILGGSQEFAVPGLPDAVGTVEQMNDKGDVCVELVGYRGDLEVRMRFWSPGVPDVAEAVTWFDRQMADL